MGFKADPVTTKSTREHLIDVGLKLMHREFSATVRKSDAGVQRSRSSLVCSIRGP
jgi:hypothetical protein